MNARNLPLWQSEKKRSKDAVSLVKRKGAFLGIVRLTNCMFTVKGKMDTTEVCARRNFNLGNPQSQ